MKQIINGKKYDTDTAEHLATAHCTENPNDFGYWRERLYLKKTGEYFLRGFVFVLLMVVHRKL